MPAPQRAKRADIYPQNLSASNFSKAWKINSPFFQALEKARKIYPAESSETGSLAANPWMASPGLVSQARLKMYFFQIRRY
jgi:hypothetical protein